MSKKDKKNQHKEESGGHRHGSHLNLAKQGNEPAPEGAGANLQVEPDRETGNWTVHPIVRSEKDPAKWIVECTSKNEANTLKNDISNGKAKPPIEDPQHYSTPKRHSNGKTLIYYPKAS